MPIDFKSRDTVSIQFDLGLPALLVHESICHRVACFGLLSSMRNTCPSHLNLLSLMMRSILCSFVWFCMSSLRTLSFHEIPKSRRWNLWCAASSFFFCGIVRGHSSALYSIVDMTSDSYSLTLTFRLLCLFLHTSCSLPNTLLALPILIWQSLSQLPLVQLLAENKFTELSQVSL